LYHYISCPQCCVQLRSKIRTNNYCLIEFDARWSIGRKEGRRKKRKGKMVVPEFVSDKVV
jgi:hypothetical protein